jgi:hypothetical protein
MTVLREYHASLGVKVSRVALGNRLAATDDYLLLRPAGVAPISKSSRLRPWFS